MAGNLFFEMGQYDLAHHYFSEALGDNHEKSNPEVTLRLAESLFFSGKLDAAVTFYESLLDAPRYSGQSAYRLINIFLGKGQNEKALKLYRNMTERQTEERWMDLAAETVKSVTF